METNHPWNWRLLLLLQSHFSRVRLCDPIDCSPPGSAVPGILQARTRVGCHFLLQWRKVKSESELSQSCLTLPDTIDCSLPGSSVHGIFQARILEWGAIAFSRNWRLAVLKTIKIMPIKSPVTNINMTIRADCAVSASSPSPSMYKSSN